MKTEWYTKSINEHRVEIAYSALAVVVIAIANTIWWSFSDSVFIWHEINPISFPSILNLRFYGAITFVTLGAWLYHLGFWQWLYRTSSNYRSFQQDKKDFWLILTGATFLLISLVIYILNNVISLVFNVYSFIQFIFPPLGISLILIGVIYSLYRRNSKSKMFD